MHWPCIVGAVIGAILGAVYGFFQGVNYGMERVYRARGVLPEDEK